MRCVAERDEGEESRLSGAVIDREWEWRQTTHHETWAEA
jgi:hypothetical protein